MKDISDMDNELNETEWLSPDSTKLQVADGKFKVEFEAVPAAVIAEDDLADQEREIAAGLEDLEKCFAINAEKLARIDAEIDRLTNHADGFDYTIAVASGVICGLIDSFFVGEFDWGNAKKWSYQNVNKFVSKYAKDHGYTGDSRKLKDHIAFLEKKFNIPSDNIWSGKGKGISAKSHHLDDWAHHPSPLGWICSVLTQFTKKGYFTNADGEGFAFDVENQELIGGSIPEKFAAGTINWFGHLVSDLAGSKSSSGKKGMGLPGPIVTLAKEISSIPGINKTKLSKVVNDIFVKQKFDFRKELALAHELGRQAIPVVINEILVRLFYFLRRLVQQWKEYGFSGIKWKEVLPFNNRTIVRMVTIASGTFTAVDLADAAIRGAIASKGDPTAFGVSFLLHVNFVGVGRFVLAVGSDLKMGWQRADKQWERIVAMNEKLHLLNAKISYRQAQAWVQVERTEQAVELMLCQCETSYRIAMGFVAANEADFKAIRACAPRIEEKNPGLVKDVISQLDSPF